MLQPSPLQTTETEEATCPLGCSIRGEDFLFAAPHDRTGELFRVVRCRSCQTVFLNPRPSCSALRRYYEEDYYGPNNKKFDQVTELAVGWFVSWRAHVLERYVPPGGKILDVGCGRGNFLEAMADRAYRDVVASGRYSYEAFIHFLDRTLEESWQDRPSNTVASTLPAPPCDAFPAFRQAYQRSLQDHFLRRTWAALPEWSRRMLMPVVDRQRWKNLWIRCPSFVRTVLRPVFSRVKTMLKGE